MINKQLLPETAKKSSIVVISSTASVSNLTWACHASLKTSILSSASLERGRTAKTLAAFITWGHKFSICAAAVRTIFTPSSLLDMLQARLATYKSNYQN